MVIASPTNVSNKTHHDPFGMLLVGRNWEGGSEYRYGFNTQEQDDEVYGNGNLNTAKFWEYDTRLGRRWCIDPKPIVGISSYACFKNNSIIYRDLLGDTTLVYNGDSGDLIAMLPDKNQNTLIILTNLTTLDIQFYSAFNNKEGYASMIESTAKYNSMISKNNLFINKYDFKTSDFINDNISEYDLLLSANRKIITSYVKKETLKHELNKIIDASNLILDKMETIKAQNKPFPGDPRSGTDIVTNITLIPLQKQLTELKNQRLALESNLKAETTNFNNAYNDREKIIEKSKPTESELTYPIDNY